MRPCLFAGPAREKMHTSPETAIILGTGLGSLVHEITDKYEISYKEGERSNLVLSEFHHIVGTAFLYTFL